MGKIDTRDPDYCKAPPGKLRVVLLDPLKGVITHRGDAPSREALRGYFDTIPDEEADFTFVFDEHGEPHRWRAAA